MKADVQFSGPEPGVVTLRGVEYVVGPLTMRQRRRIMKSFERARRPAAAVVDVKGLVEAMYRVPDDPWLNAKDPIHAAKGIAATRNQIADVVLQAVREARALAETWPPAPEDPRGLMLITQDPQIQATFLFEVISRHNPSFTMALASALAGADESDEDESLTVQEFSTLLDAVFPAPSQSRPEVQDEAAEHAGNGAVPKWSGSGGDGSTHPDRPGAASPSTTPASTSS